MQGSQHSKSTCPPRHGSPQGPQRTHTRSHITMLIKELDIHIIDTGTGEIIRHQTLNPNDITFVAGAGLEPAK